MKASDTFQNTIRDLEESQKADHDGRTRARESDHFVNKKDGQWEPEVAKQNDKKPRYTFDKVSSIISDLCGEINGKDFDIKVSPAGGLSTNDIALHYDGLIRTIENASPIKAKYVYRAAARQMITTGLGGWRILTGWRPSSFGQELYIKNVSNFMDRVWFDPGAEERDMSDSDYGFMLTSMSNADYERDFPEASGMSVCSDRTNSVYFQKKSDAITIGEVYRKKIEKVNLILMSDDSVYVEDDKYKKVKDELESQGIVPVKDRDSEITRVYHRLFDGDGFLTESSKTVFDYVPLIPAYANFEISEDKIIYWGIVEKLMDPQRVLNYSESRRIEEGALAPRAKKWMTSEQAKGHEKAIRTMNTNADPVQFYNHVPDQPPPFETGGAQINAGLVETSQSMGVHIRSISNRVDPSQPEALAVQSGVALDALDRKGDNANFEYFNAVEIAICHTARILINAIPKVYDTTQEIRLTNQDKTTKTITVNQPVFDEQTQEMVELNNLAKGSYAASCSAGPAYENRQQETVTAITELAEIDPSVMQLGGDVLLANIPAPGIDKLAKRKRQQMLDTGMIPEEELTDEEQAYVIKKAQEKLGQQPSAMDQALIATAEAEQKKADAQTQDTLSKVEERQAKLQLELMKMQRENEKLKAEMASKRQDDILKLYQAQDDQIKTMAETLKIIKDAIGPDAIVGMGNMNAYRQQTERLTDAQEGAD